MVIYEIVTLSMYLFTITSSILLIQFILSAIVILQFYILYLVIKRGWKNYYFKQFSQWSFMIFSNLFYDYHFRANLENFPNSNQKVKIPKFFKNFLSLNDFFLTIEKKKWKYKRKGINYRFKGFPKVYLTKKRKKYEFWNYKFTYRKNTNINFSILLLKFDKISFFYLALPPSLRVNHLNNIGVRLPFHYASKIPMSSSILNELVDYSDTIMQYKNREPFIYNYFRIFAFIDKDQDSIKDIEEKMKIEFLLPQLKEIEGFNDFQHLFESPIIRKTKSAFEYEYYLVDFISFENHNSIRFSFNRYGYMENSFLFKLIDNFDRQFYFHSRIQDSYLFKFILFLDWLKSKLTLINHSSLRNLTINLMDIKGALERDYITEFEFFEVLNLNLKNEQIEFADDVRENPKKQHLRILKLLIDYLTILILECLKLTNQSQGSIDFVKDIKEINREIKSLSEKLEKSGELKINTGYEIMDEFISSKLKDKLELLKLKNDYENDFFNLLNYLINRMIYSHDYSGFIQEPTEKWWEEHKLDKKIEMEAGFFQPKIRDILKIPFGQQIFDTPIEARGHIDLKLTFKIPIELKVFRDKTSSLKTSSIQELEKHLNQIESEMINSPIGFLIGLDFRKKIDSKETRKPNTEYIKFIFKSYEQTNSLIVLLVFLANKKTPSEN